MSAMLFSHHHNLDCPLVTKASTNASCTCFHLKPEPVTVTGTLPKPTPAIPESPAAAEVDLSVRPWQSGEPIMDADDLRDLIQEYADADREYHSMPEGPGTKGVLKERNEAMHCAIAGFTEWVKYGRRPPASPAAAGLEEMVDELIHATISHEAFYCQDESTLPRFQLAKANLLAAIKPPASPAVAGTPPRGQASILQRILDIINEWDKHDSAVAVDEMCEIRDLAEEGIKPLVESQAAPGGAENLAAHAIESTPVEAQNPRQSEPQQSQGESKGPGEGTGDNGGAG